MSFQSHFREKSFMRARNAAVQHAQIMTNSATLSALERPEGFTTCTWISAKNADTFTMNGWSNMGYFSNGTEGSMFKDRYCSRCVHREGPDGKSGCAVWLAHLLFSYKLCNDKEDEGKQILDLLIPLDGAYNGDCAMFHEGSAVVAKGCLDGHLIHGEPATVMPAMREWAKQKGLIVK